MKAISPGRDGKGVYCPEWAPHPVDKPGDKPARPRFPGGGQGAREGTTVPTATIPRSRPKSDVGACLDGVVEWAGGSPKAPPPRAPESAKIPAIQPPSEPANRQTSWKEGECSTPGGHENSYIENTQPPTRVIPNVLDNKTTEEEGESVWEVGRKLLFRRMERQAALMHDHHMRFCLKKLLNPANGVEIWETDDTRWHRHGYKRCNCMGCVYCRLLHAAEARTKSMEFQKGWVKRGSWSCMAALTFGHPDAAEPYIALNRVFKRALAAMRRGNVWKRFMAFWGIGEYMYANEDMINVLYGWHPHQHVIYEIVASYIAAHPELETKEGRDAWVKAFQAAHYKIWQSALVKFGRTASPTYGLVPTLHKGSDQSVIAGADYITKMANEMTGAAEKRGKNGSRSPYGLLDDGADQSLPQEQRDLADAKFIEYQKGIRNRVRYFFSESHAEPTAPGESEVPEPKDEPGKRLVMTVSKLQDRMLRDVADGWADFLTLGERKGVEAATAWLRWFSDSSRWSWRFLRNNGPAAPPYRRYVFGEEAA